MARRIDVFLLQLLLIFVLLIVPMSSGNVNEGFKDDMDPIHLLHKDGIYSRKLWMLDATMQDYDEGGANPKHDPSYPPKRRPGHP